MTVQQLGTYRHGTFGYPVDVTLAVAPLPPVALTSVVSISMTMQRPGESVMGVPVSLPVPGCIIDGPGGTFEFIIQNGDLTVAGIYHYIFTLVFPGSATLVIDATMGVT